MRVPHTCNWFFLLGKGSISRHAAALLGLLGGSHEFSAFCFINIHWSCGEGGCYKEFSTPIKAAAGKICNRGIICLLARKSVGICFGTRKVRCKYRMPGIYWGTAPDPTLVT